eukprot:gene1382-1402_t
MTMDTIKYVTGPARFDIWNTSSAGFGRRVEKSGTKTFIVRYRAEGGGRTAHRRFATVWRFSPLTVDEACKQARIILCATATSEEPAGERQYESDGCFVQRGLRQGDPMKARTKAYTVARLRHHVIPLLGHKRVRDVGPGDIERLVCDVGAGKTAFDKKIAPRKRIIVRGGDGAARKLFRDLSAVFSFAERRGLVPNNPCDLAAVRKTNNRRERLPTLQEVKRLSESFDAYENNGSNVKAICIARSSTLTGCRRDEIAGFRWSEVDFDRGLLIFADSKTGRPVRSLGTAALALLKFVSRSENSEFIFPAASGKGLYQGTKQLWPKLVAMPGLTGVAPHTLRHTMESTAVSTGEGVVLTGAILGHANVRSTEPYAHIQNHPSRRASNRVSGKIAAALASRSA